MFKSDLQSVLKGLRSEVPTAVEREQITFRSGLLLRVKTQESATLGEIGYVLHLSLNDGKYFTNLWSYGLDSKDEYQEFFKFRNRCELAKVG